LIWLSGLIQKAILAAAAITGKKFALVVGSSLVATTGILAAGMTSNSNDVGLLAALLSRNLAANQAPAPVAAAEGPEEETEATGGEPETAPRESEPSSSASSPEAAPESEETSEEPEEEEAPPPEEETIPGPIQHVFVINLASSGYEAAFGGTPQMPYLSGTLRPQGNLLSNYALLGEAATANSIAAISGQRPNAATKANCPTNDNFPPNAIAKSSGFVSGDGCIYPVATLSLADQMSSDQLKWKAYMESMVDEAGAPANCVYPEPGTAEVPVTGGYSVTLNPFTRFHSLLDLGDCSANDMPLTELDKDLKKVETTPNYSYISPNLCDAGVAGQCPAGAPQGAPAADAFLSQVAPKILKSAAFKKDGLLIVSFNQINPPAVDPATGAATPAPAEPLKVGTLLISRYAGPGGTDATPYDPYSVLRSTEDLFQLDHLAGAAPTKVRSFAPALLGENGGD
jgi:hypothetical protein